CNAPRTLDFIGVRVRARFGEHLRAKADAEKWFLLLECNADPVGFPADELIRVVGAHGAAKNDGTAVVCKRRGERAVAGLAHIECVIVAAKPVADVARLGPLLVKHDMGVTAQPST